MLNYPPNIPVSDEDENSNDIFLYLSNDIFFHLSNVKLMCSLYIGDLCADIVAAIWSILCNQEYVWV